MGICRYKCDRRWQCDAYVGYVGKRAQVSVRKQGEEQSGHHHEGPDVHIHGVIIREGNTYTITGTRVEMRR